jgi:hypothetical protein
MTHTTMMMVFRLSLSIRLIKTMRNFLLITLGVCAYVKERMQIALFGLRILWWNFTDHDK